MRILVTGNAGSGKTTLGKKLSDELNIPLYGLDKVVWKENWTPTPRDEVQKLIKEITDKEAWIIEGVSKLALNEADKVYFLDIPAYKCVINILIRFIKNGLGSRKELPDNCPEYIGFLKAIKIALIFDRVTKPWLIQRSANVDFVQIKSYKELKNHI